MLVQLGLCQTCSNTILLVFAARFIYKHSTNTETKSQALSYPLNLYLPESLSFMTNFGFDLLSLVCWLLVNIFSPNWMQPLLSVYLTSNAGGLQVSCSTRGSRPGPLTPDPNVLSLALHL